MSWPVAMTTVISMPMPCSDETACWLPKSAGASM